MKINDVFETGNITYSIIDVLQREVRVGTGVFNDTISNAVNNSYNGSITIPNFVVYDNKLWRVTEIGQCSFVHCNNITNFVIGYNIAYLRQYAIYRCYNVSSIIFEEHSRLKKCETYSLYDLYSLKEISFGGDRLESLGKYAMSYTFFLEYIRLPASVSVINESAFKGLDSLKEVHYCGKSSITNDIFFRVKVNDYLTPSDIKVKVTSSYPSTTFGKNDTVIVDDSIDCDFPQSLSDFDLLCKTVYNNYNIHLSYSYFSIFILMYDS